MVIKSTVNQVVKEIDTEINRLQGVRASLVEYSGGKTSIAAHRKSSLTRRFKKQPKDEMEKLREDYHTILAESDRPLRMKEIMKELRTRGHKKSEKKVHANINWEVVKNLGGMVRVGRGLFTHKDSKYYRVARRGKKAKAQAKA